MNNVLKLIKKNIEVSTLRFFCFTLYFVQSFTDITNIKIVGINFDVLKKIN